MEGGESGSPGGLINLAPVPSEQHTQDMTARWTRNKIRNFERIRRNTPSAKKTQHTNQGERERKNSRRKSEGRAKNK